MGLFKRKEKAGKKETLQQSRVWIDQKVGVEYCADSTEMYLEILQDYCSESQKIKKQLEECMKKQDWKNFAVYVHSVKSSSKTIGAVDFSDEALKLEMAAKEGDLKTIQKEWSEFCLHFEQVIREAEQVSAV